jgi:type II secretory ATPase GspE/PulE/Tfp pilus assembly ATPase PilB-like protein
VIAEPADCILGSSRAMAGLFRRANRLVGFRIVLIIAAVIVVFAVSANWAWAVETNWPAFDKPTPNPGENFRSAGFYMSWVKIVMAWLVFLAWVRSTDWISIDIQELNLKELNYLMWNPIVFGTFMFAFILLWLLPMYFSIGFILLLIAYITPLTTYVILRNSLVDNDRRVFTSEHLRFWFASHLTRVGMKVDPEKPDPRVGNSAVTLKAFGGDERTNNTRLLLSRQSPGFFISQEIVADGLANRCTAIMLDCTQQGAAVNIMVDGVWLPRPPRDREQADPIVESLKILCGLDQQDRQNLQSGKFLALYEKSKRIVVFNSQGTPTGERILLQLEETAIRFKSLDDLGMRVKMQGQLKELLESSKGIVLLSAMPGDGLRSTTDVALQTCDRFVREFIAIEEESSTYRRVENVPVTFYKKAEDQTPATILPKLLRTQPEVVVVRDIVNTETLNILCEASSDKLIISTIRAKDCVEAIWRTLSMGVQPADFAEHISAVLCQRLVRKLCNDCMEAYVPPPQVLLQLGIPEGRIEAFYRPKQPPQEPDPKNPYVPCATCNGIGYMGRTAIFELLVVGETVRKALVSNPNPDLLRRAARKDSMKSMQEEGILLVAKGVTSLPELLRVLKQ